MISMSGRTFNEKVTINLTGYLLDPPSPESKMVVKMWEEPL